MFYEKSLFEIDAEEAKLPCKWCEDEVPEDELYHGVCLTCIENYYEPELAMQFLENTGLEAYFYVTDYMHTDWNTIDTRVIDACKAEFTKNLQMAKFNAVNFPSLYAYDEKSVWELQCLKEYVLSHDVFYDWAEWVIDYDKTREKVAAAAKAGKVVMIATQPAKQESMANILGTLGFLVFAMAALFLSCLAENKRKVGFRCRQYTSRTYAHY